MNDVWRFGARKEEIKMKAAYIEEYGGSDQFKIGELPMPEIGVKDVLIEVHAASINPVDWKIRQGYLKTMIPYQMPLVLGWDVAGTVSAVGSEVTDFKIGDEVFSRPNIMRQGTYAEFVAVDANLVVAKPAKLSFEQAAALPLVAHTAWEVMFEIMDLKAGDRIFIGAGSGGVGTVAIQLARAYGAYVVTSTSTKNLEWVKALGADEVVDYTVQNPNDTVRGMNFILDAVGGEQQAQMYQMLKPNGLLVSITSQPNEEQAKAAGMRSAYVFMQPNGERLKKIAQAVDDGQLMPVIDSVFVLTQTKQAHDHAETGHAKGKVVIKVR
jgi:NADPH:quinone reductase-like Zn-dependent oxidoreductase